MNQYTATPTNMKWGHVAAASPCLWCKYGKPNFAFGVVMLYVRIEQLLWRRWVGGNVKAVP